MKNSARDAAVKWIATAGGIGLLPAAPGTWASATAAIAAWFCSPEWIVVAIGLSAAAGLWVSAPSRRVLGSEDPGTFVMDEVCGMLISVAFLPREWHLWAIAFVLFRILDMLKPWPIRWVQKRTQAWSIMGDDILAGLISNLLLRAYLLWR